MSAKSVKIPRPGLRRGACSLALGAALLLLSGDRAHSALTGGIDPLEILSLAIKPNVIVVMDSSTSMRESIDGVAPVVGDWPESKMFKAKQVLKQVIQSHQSRVSFLFGQYEQFNSKPADQDRFVYVTDASASPDMLSNEIRIRGALDDTPLPPLPPLPERGLQGWQEIKPAWGRIHYEEIVGGGAVVVTSPFTIGAGTNDKVYFRQRKGSQDNKFVSCQITLPASLYTTYDTSAEMSALASELTTRMTAGYVGADRTCTPHGGGVSLSDLTISFTVTWDVATAQFTITSSASPPSYQIIVQDGPRNLLPALGYTEDRPSAASWSNDTPSSHSSWSTNTTPFKGNVLGTGTAGAIEACSVDVVAADTFFQNGADLAAAIQAKMNGDGCPAIAQNLYSVKYEADGTFSFSISTGSAVFQDFRLLWSNPDPNIGKALGNTTVNSSLDRSTKVTNAALILARRSDLHEYDPDGAGPLPMQFWFYSRRFLNGHTITVDSSDRVCGIAMDLPATSPPTARLRKLSGACASGVSSTATFSLVGANWAGADEICNGFQSNVALQACDSAAVQFSSIGPFLENETKMSADGLSVDNYSDGYIQGTASPPYPNLLPGPTKFGIVADGLAPIGDSLDDILSVFTALWNGTANPAIGPGVGAISSHSDPKERTIVLFVTDGDDNCANVADIGDDAQEADNRALAAAYRAQLLYDPIVGGVQSPSGAYAAGADPASSVITYIVGFGSGPSVDRLNWIAWGGSGMQRATTIDNGVTRWSSEPTAADRALCTACRDAYVAPDASTLQAVLNQVIEQGAATGSFTAQQSIVAAVFELTSEVAGFSPDDPRKRFEALVPNQFQASFDLPGFQGKLRAIQSFESGPGVFTPFTKWEAGQKLLTRVQSGAYGAGGMNNMTPVLTGAVAGQGTFSQLHGNFTFNDATIAASTAGIKRRIYTTTRNGSFTLGAGGIIDANLASLRSGASPNRTPLWPPPASIAPADDTSQGSLDAALGLPTDAQISAGAVTELNALEATFKACLGTLPAGSPADTGCNNASDVLKAQRARREAREMVLAFTAGAELVPDGSANPVRVTGGTDVGEILYKARAWVLGESTLAPPAVVAPPINTEPSNFRPEYQKYRDSPQASNIAQNGLSQGFGLRNPEGAPTTFDSLTPSSGNDGRTTLKPVMSVVYLGTNQMLHAFRSGPSCRVPGGVGPAATYSTCSEQGGDELWGFVPFDRLVALKALMQPQARENKTYVIATAIRFADVFVDAPGGTMTAGVGSASVTGRGMWRQVLFFGRGAGGKFLTALDVTGRGAYTTSALDTQAPIVWWSRGNPDTDDGTASGNDNNNASDRTAYSKMGETWSVPAIAFVDRSANVTARRPYDASTGLGGVPMVAYAGSGYCSPCNAGEGTTFFTLDATSGDVVAAVDVETEASAAGVSRSGLAYANALVASPVAFSAPQLTPGIPGHPAERTTRVYVGDLHGRLWKFLSGSPSQALLLADLGADQPIGTAGALLALNGVPYVFVTSGNESRAIADANAPFKIFGFRDDGDDTSATYGSATPTPDPGVNIYSPGVYQFSRVFDEANFRGTIQPATALSGSNLGRVFFGGTRFNLPGSPFALPPFPCRSSFDTIVFALGAETGTAAYDLSSSGDDAYLVFSNSRKTAIQVIKEPTSPTSPPGTQGRGMLILDEGLMGSGTVTPPPPPGLQPQIPGPPNVALVSIDQDGRRFPQMTSPRICQ